MIKFPCAAFLRNKRAAKGRAAAKGATAKQDEWKRNIENKMRYYHYFTLTFERPEFKDLSDKQVMVSRTKMCRNWLRDSHSFFLQITLH